MSSIENTQESTNQNTIVKKKEEENQIKKIVAILSWYIIFLGVVPKYNLYSSNPANLALFISTNFISLLALLGVSWNIIHYYKKYKNMWFVIRLSAIWYVVTYLLPTMGIPYFLKHLDFELDITSKVVTFVLGVLFIIIAVNLEGLLAFEYINLFK